MLLKVCRGIALVLGVFCLLASVGMMNGTIRLAEPNKWLMWAYLVVGVTALALAFAYHRVAKRSHAST